MSRAGDYLKPVMVQCALAAIKKKTLRITDSATRP
ncbi:MAG: hypothetical protein SCM11_08260 [Bacillota bacterium]|nr:hypothetical protein [Bacillota bacterium]